MPSLAEQALMLEALSGESDNHFPRGMQAYREEAARNQEKWEWCIEEAQRRERDLKDG